MSIFNKAKPSDLAELLTLCSPYFRAPFDSASIIRSASQMVGLHSGAKGIGAPDLNNLVKKLEQRWYASLNGPSPDYAVYGEPDYIGDIWACWVCYSRKSVKVLAHPTSLVNHSVVQEVGHGSRILDLGCGFGYTTLALKEIFPSAVVMGTNLETSYQFEIARKLTQSQGIQILPSPKGLGQVDLAFASEYFEHFERPIEHLFEVVHQASPRYFAIANGFNGIAIGHFKKYKHLNQSYLADVMSRAFLKALRHLGYEKMESKIWNNRPSIWKRKK